MDFYVVLESGSGVLEATLPMSTSVRGYRVAVVDICLPRNCWIDVPDMLFELLDNKDIKLQGTVPGGNFTSLDHYCNHTESRINELAKDDHFVAVSGATHSQIVTIGMNNSKFRLNLSPELLNVLGLGKLNTFGSTVGDRAACVLKHHASVHTDVIAKHANERTTLPLAKISLRCQPTQIYRINYFSLAVDYVDKLRLVLRDEHNNVLKLTHGRVSVTLHFTNKQ